MDRDSFQPSYVWPNAAFPFRLYLDNPKCRIFIIENIVHNWDWMRVYAPKFRSTDFFFVYCGWYFSEFFAKESNIIFEILKLRRENFYFLFNSERELLNFAPLGFQGSVINQNCWLDENSEFRPLGLNKVYDAVYVGRKRPFKRHYLATKISNLALVVGETFGVEVTDLPPHVYLNDKTLPPSQVSVLINQSHCGLILSESEGACFASSEYLLCGIPVVSTPSTGGRDVWYNEYNSIICEPTVESVAAAVHKIIDEPRDPEIIRADHISQAKIYRSKFINALGEVFDRFSVDLNPEQYFHETYMHKLREAYKPNFQSIFA